MVLVKPKTSAPALVTPLLMTVGLLSAEPPYTPICYVVLMVAVLVIVSTLGYVVVPWMTVCVTSVLMVLPDI